VNVISDEPLQTEEDEPIQKEIKKAKINSKDFEQSKPSKSNLNIIHINTGIKHSSSKSPEHNKLDKSKQTPKGVNIIPLKSLNKELNNDKFSPRGVSSKSPTNIINISKTGTGNKIPQSTRTNDNRFVLETKASYKSPSPNRGTNSTSNKYLKKSPEIKK
jgi:hypothetical protein